jgi:hypothetical protein
METLMHCSPSLKDYSTATEWMNVRTERVIREFLILKATAQVWFLML